MQERIAKLGVIIPAYRADTTIAQVVTNMPDVVSDIIIVNDASPDGLDATIESLMPTEPRITYLKHEQNQGVGGAMITGYKKALELDLDFIVKIDADGQMDAKHLPKFLELAKEHKCDYVKANRFGTLEAARSMPHARLFGNVILSFLNKVASGYWNIFDPQNGYIMISARTLKRINLDYLDKGYFFENSMLINLNIFHARIGEINIPAIYHGEVSSLNISRTLTSFPLKLLNGFLHRILEKYVFRSLSPVALLLATAIFFMGFGGIWSTIEWIRSYQTGIPATTGAIVIGLMPILMGWSALLQALVIDMQDSGECIQFDHDNIGPTDA